MKTQTQRKLVFVLVRRSLQHLLAIAFVPLVGEGFGDVSDETEEQEA